MKIQVQISRWVLLALLWLPAGWSLADAQGGAERFENLATVADILETVGRDADAQSRRDALTAMRTLSRQQREEAVARARALNRPVRMERPDGTVKEVARVDEAGHLVYWVTHNDKAAISTAADLMHVSPVAVSGAGVVIGMWDGGAGRATHQEFDGGRMLIQDGSAPINHATHVGGTLAAGGAVARAKGMAFEAVVHSYDWNDDKAEMASRAATAPGQIDALYLSNHSYGIITGWYRTGGTNPAYIWYGSGTNQDALDPRFGQYNTFSRDSDAIAYDAPYYLIFRSAGNDRVDNPNVGQTVQLSPSTTATVTYDPALHPPGDNVYRGGYDTLGFDSVAKNVLTVGSVADAVTSGLRDVSKATMSGFSSWGPTDDGRIKPDLVANGEELYSSLNGGNASYGNFSGTSMSAPNATGTAALLVEAFSRLFPGEAMRASTLKGLLIHTADDLGTPGPNYQFGWGLINGKAALDFLEDYQAHPEKGRMVEATLSSAVVSLSYDFVWDGVTPIRATLSWTDPAGAATTSSDLRSPRLRNNLDLRIVGPDNQSVYPYVMPFVGTWTVESMSEPATTGVNNTDNVEQVYIAAPPESGVYRVVVSYQGSLTNQEQTFSLLVDGASGEEPPPPPLSLLSVSPYSAFSGGSVTLSAEGLRLGEATDLLLLREGFPDRVGTGLRMDGDLLLAEVDLSDAQAGLWTVQVASAEGTSSLADAFTVIGAIWSENFDGTIEVWTSEVVGGMGTNQWVVVTDQVHSPPNAYFAPGPASRSTTALVSPAIAIPDAATDMQLRFWHRYNLQNRRDGGRLEFRIGTGNWTGIDDTNSGMAFASNGYTNKIQGGNPNNRSTFAGQDAWTGNSGGYIETIVNLIDSSRFQDKNLQFRWVLATDNSTASPGWHVDSIVLLGGGDLVNQPPVIVNPITVTGAETVTENEETIFVVREASAGLQVLAEDNGGAANLSYTWSATGDPPVFFLPNGTADSASTTAFFEATGDYTVLVTVTDAGGLSVSASALLRVESSATALQISPGSASLRVGEGLLFQAAVLDQFNDPLPEPEQPETFHWASSGGGTIDAQGSFTATTVGENFTISASTGTVEGSVVFQTQTMVADETSLSEVAQVTVLPASAEVFLTDLEVMYDGNPQEATVTTDPVGLDVKVTYDGSETLPVEVGTYAVLAEVTDTNYEGSATGSFSILAAVNAEREAFDAWIAECGLTGEDAEPDADPDGDGMSNWMEWLFGFDPTDPDSVWRVSILLDENGMTLHINRVITRGTITVEASGDLLNWPISLPLTVEADEDDYLFPLDVEGFSIRFFRARFSLDAEEF